MKQLAPSHKGQACYSEEGQKLFLEENETSSISPCWKHKLVLKVFCRI